MRTAILAAALAVAMTGARAQDAIDMSGFYMGGTALYGGGSDIEESDRRAWRDPQIDSFDPNKFQIGGFAGYNVMHGNVLLGLEFDVRAGTSKSVEINEDGRDVTIYPAWSQTSSGDFSDANRPSIYGFVDGGRSVSDFRTEYGYKEKVAPTISARVGYQHNNLLVYGRLGAGVALIEETFIQDDSRSVYCERESTRQDFNEWGGYSVYRTGCINPYSGARQTKSKDAVRPTATLALGAEYHFDRVFARVEGEMRHLFLDDKLMFSPSDGATRYAISTSVGFRF